MKPRNQTTPNRSPLLPLLGERANVPTVPFNILVKRLKAQETLRQWWFRETKDGGFLQRYIGREKHLMQERFKRIGRLMGDWKQPAKTDFQLRAAIPARLYHRLKQEDPHFFEDNQNLKNLKRDNPDAFVKV